MRSEPMQMRRRDFLKYIGVSAAADYKTPFTPVNRFPTITDEDLRQSQIDEWGFASCRLSGK
jgi:hypothetical protein